MKKVYLAIILLLGLILLTTTSFSRRFIIRRAMVISFPKVVKAKPGEEIIISGNVTNIGTVWLRRISIEVYGLPFEYKLFPDYLEYLPIRWSWSPTHGLRRIPKSLHIVVKVPKNASGVYEVTYKLQEHLTILEVYNTTTFKLIVENRTESKEVEKPKIKVESLSLPEKVISGKPFLLNISLINEGGATDLNISLSLPKSWSVDNTSKIITLGKDEKALVSFNVTPTEESGNVSFLITYGKEKSQISFLRTGELIVPLPIEKEKPRKVEIWPFLVVILSVLVIFLTLKNIRIKIERKTPEKVPSKVKK
ncbi:MAG: hypothetical protein J7L39_01525 [Candidatus Aenigmarchaeota archaeon]|nr:hypothetical protein [Candidatus Aenigmarchaeota archaeon]